MSLLHTAWLDGTLQHFIARTPVTIFIYILGAGGVVFFYRQLIKANTRKVADNAFETIILVRDAVNYGSTIAILWWGVFLSNYSYSAGKIQTEGEEGIVKVTFIWMAGALVVAAIDEILKKLANAHAKYPFRHEWRHLKYAKRVQSGRWGTPQIGKRIPHWRELLATLECELAEGAESEVPAPESMD
jgi:hypothetical protein